MAIAIPCILLGKYAVVHLIVGKFDVLFNAADDNTMISIEADQIAEARVAAGQTVNWPEEKDSDDAPVAAHYPADIWAEALQRWNQLSPDERQAKKNAHEQEMGQLLGDVKANLRKVAFQNSFGVFDLLWFGLAALTAFRLGSGNVSGD